MLLNSKVLVDLVSCPLKIRTCSNTHWQQTFKECLDICLSEAHSSNYEPYIFKINCVLDYLHEELNTGHWSTVPLETRENFTIASFTKALLLLLCPTVDLSIEKRLQQCIKALDLGLILGAPLEDNPDLLTQSAKYIQNQLSLFEATSNIVCNKRKTDNTSYFIKEFDELNAALIKDLHIPSIESFNKHFFTPQVPVKLKGCMEHWPASTKWLDANYLLKIAGDRTVPIEIGSHYTDENWSQKLMTLKEFISKHYLSEDGNIGYLAQHNLFNQIAELKEDIRIPEYCCCSLDFDSSTEPDINAWLGPKGTVSPLHQDPKNNILAQVYGTKRIILISPSDTDRVYPHSEQMLSNTAQIDPLEPDYDKFPEFKRAQMFKCLLEPGEMLFIPVKWWHHVTAFEKSFSVSFWWQ